MKKEFRSFKDARKIIRSFHLNTIDDWRIFCKSQDFPNGVPKAPHLVYKKEWRGVGDWLETGRIATMKKEFLSFLEARQFVHSLNIKSNREWRNYCKSGKKPNDIPTTPARTYKNKGWINEGDWLGTGTIASYNVQFRSFFEAKKFVQTLKLQNEKEWREYCKSGNKPDNIPATPARHYKKEWTSMGDWLGTRIIANRNKKYLPFLEARKLIRSLEMKNVDGWRKWCKSSMRQENIPAHPHVVYKKEWVDYADWLGSGNIANREISKNYLQWIDAKPIYQKFAQKYGLKNKNDWQKFKKTHKKLLEKFNLPPEPWRVYSKDRIQKKLSEK